MHEWGLARRLVALVEAEARTRQLIRVKRVRLETDMLGAAEREALLFNFKTAAEGTIAQDAELEIVERPARALCPTCLAEVMMIDHDHVCPRCRAAPLTPLDGETLRITELVAI